MYALKIVRVCGFIMVVAVVAALTSGLEFGGTDWLELGKGMVNMFRYVVGI